MIILAFRGTKGKNPEFPREGEFADTENRIPVHLRVRVSFWFFFFFNVSHVRNGFRAFTFCFHLETTLNLSV